MDKNTQWKIGAFQAFLNGWSLDYLRHVDPSHLQELRDNLTQFAWFLRSTIQQEEEREHEATGSGQAQD